LYSGVFQTLVTNLCAACIVGWRTKEKAKVKAVTLNLGVCAMSNIADTIQSFVEALLALIQDFINTLLELLGLGNNTQ
jgi:hypothetical protein